MSVGVTPYQGSPASIGTIKDITERKRAEEQMQLLSSITKQSTEGIALVDMEGNLQFINNAFANMHGYTPDELKGKNLSIFHNPEQMPFVNEINKQIKETGEFHGELWHTRRDGTVFPTIMHNSIFRDKSGKPIGLIGTVRDITERKQAEEGLRTTHERLQATLDALPDLLFELDHSGTIIDFRAPHPEILYLPPSEFIGKKVDKLLPKDATKVIMASIKEAVQTGHHSGNTYSLIINEKVSWFELSIAVRGNPKSPDSHFIALVRDITDRKENEIILKKTSEELKTEREALKEKNIALRQVLENIDSQRQDYQQQLYQEIDAAVTPVIKKLKEIAGRGKAREFEDLEANLNAILTKDLSVFKKRFAKLTSRESEICQMIKSGMSSKEISDKLNLSLLTVLKHREQIRKKLGITNKNINLATYLRSH